MGPAMQIETRNPARRLNRGFSLIEVLVTLVIISLATLGMAKLQAVSMRTNTNALFESQAATLARDIIERIRANPAGDYTTAFDQAVPDEAVPTCIGAGANCDATAMAQHDLMEWKCTLGVAAFNDACAPLVVGGQLPNGNGSITIAANTYTVRIRWFDMASNATRLVTFTTVI
jgi:type IV pilus modification protein PilV